MYCCTAVCRNIPYPRERFLFVFFPRGDMFIHKNRIRYRSAIGDEPRNPNISVYVPCGSSCGPVSKPGCSTAKRVPTTPKDFHVLTRGFKRGFNSSTPILLLCLASILFLIYIRVYIYIYACRSNRALKIVQRVWFLMRGMILFPGTCGVPAVILYHQYMYVCHFHLAA